MMRKILMLFTVLALAIGAQAAVVQIDFGVPDPNIVLPSPTDPNQWLPSGGNWNNAWYIGQANGGADSVFPNLTDTTGANSGLTLTVPNDWETDGDGGVPTNTLGYPQPNASDDYIGCGVHVNKPYSAGLPGPPVEWHTVTLSGCTEPEYTLTVYGAREAGSWGAPNARMGYFSVDGGATMQLQVHDGNTSNVNVFPNVAPDANGEITLSASGVGNIDPIGRIFGYAYLNVLEVEIPEPATMSLLALGGLVAIRRRR